MKALCLCWCSSSWEPGIQPQTLLLSFPARSFVVIMKQELGPEQCSPSLGFCVEKTMLLCISFYFFPALWLSSFTGLLKQLRAAALLPFASVSRLCHAHCVCAESTVPLCSQGTPGSLSAAPTHWQRLSQGLPKEAGLELKGDGAVWPEQLLTPCITPASPALVLRVWIWLWCSQQSSVLSTDRDYQIWGI